MQHVTPSNADKALTQYDEILTKLPEDAEKYNYKSFNCCEDRLDIFFREISFSIPKELKSVLIWFWYWATVKQALIGGSARKKWSNDYSFVARKMIIDHLQKKETESSNNWNHFKANKSNENSQKSIPTVSGEAKIRRKEEEQKWATGVLNEELNKLQTQRHTLMQVP